MKKNLLLILIVMMSYISFSLAQIRAITGDSTKNETTVLVIDSLTTPGVDSLTAMLNKNDSLKVKLIFKNNHQWNNWALDTTFTRSELNSIDKILLQKQPYRLKFKYIPLKSQHLAKSEKIKKYLKPGLATLAIMSNWGSFYLKRVADDYYDRYRSTSNLHEINYYYRKTQQFDQWSNVLLGVSVVSISVYLYLLLKG